MSKLSLLSLNVGTPRTLRLEDGKPWRSAIHKVPAEERLTLGETNLDGDRQANLRFHGGPDKAVCCFSAEHYSHWRERLNLSEAGFPFGAFGENFTLVDMIEADVCVGDVYAIGTARVQVSQPRQPCMNLVYRWGLTAMPEEMIELNHTGFYLRVLQPGEVGRGDSLQLLQRSYPNLTICKVNGAKYRREGGRELSAILAELPELAESWRSTFRKRSTRPIKGTSD